MTRSRLAAAAAALATLGAVVPAAADASARSPYVVVLTDTADCPAAIAAVTGAYGVRLGTTYTSAFCGFSAKLTSTQAVALSADPAVASVTPDTPVTAV